MFNAIMTRLGYEKRADSSYQESLVALLTNQAGGSRAFATATAASGNHALGRWAAPSRPVRSMVQTTLWKH